MTPKVDLDLGWHSGEIPEVAKIHAERKFSVYVHVPFCKSRCGYCDFTTFTNAELGGNASAKSYAKTICTDIYQTAERFKNCGISLPPVHTVFFGGGTPTFLPAKDLNIILSTIKEVWGLERDAEVTTEANPESVNLGYIAELKDNGFSRISFGMQSASAQVIQILEREHTPKKVQEVIEQAKQVGIHTSVDLIYATPGETLSQWEYSIKTAIEIQPEHISCYALGIEPGTRLGRAIKKGKLSAVDDDDAARKYEIADQLITNAGFSWYEISNWAKSGFQCRHNLAYWQNQNWWGFGPGAHSHLGNWRAWNLRHPRPWTQKVEADNLPLLGAEELDVEARNLETVMLALRLHSGLDVENALASGVIRPEQAHALEKFITWGWLEEEAILEGVARPTLFGRILLDKMITEIMF